MAAGGAWPAVIVLGIETSTPQTSVALGTEPGSLATLSVAGRARQEVVAPALDQLLRLDADLTCARWAASRWVSARACSPACGSGSRPPRRSPRCCSADRGHASLDVAGVRGPAQPPADRRGDRRPARGGLLRGLPPVPGGVVRRDRAWSSPGPTIWSPNSRRAAGDVLVVGNGAILYRQELEGAGKPGGVRLVGAAHPEAAPLVELAVPRFLREEHDRLFDVAHLPEEVRCGDRLGSASQRRRGSR